MGKYLIPTQTENNDFWGLNFIVVVYNYLDQSYPDKPITAVFIQVFFTEMIKQEVSGKKSYQTISNL